MATHNSAPGASLNTYRSVMSQIPEEGFHFSKDDVQYLLDVIKEKDEVIRQLSSGDYFVHY